MAPADLPHDGHGGYLYRSNAISFPTYANTTLYTSYATIDDYLFTSSGSATTFGVAFGACLMTLIHVLAFTAPDKRGRIIFNCVVIGLLLEVIRQFCAIWAVTRSGTNSAYFLLTLPADDATDTEAQAAAVANAYTNFSLGTRVNAVIDGLASVLAFFAIQVCFYVLVRTMMSAMRRRTVRLFMTLLAGLGAHAVVWRFVQFIWNTITVFDETYNFGPPWWVFLGAQIAYTISICAWCLVYGFLVIRSVLTRIRLGIEFKRGEARHVMFMTTLESMIIPIMFIVLQWLAPSWFPESEYCVAPSILILLPFGTLWASSFDANEAHRGHAGRYQPNENRDSTADTSNPIASNATSTDSPSQPLFDRRATKSPGLRTIRNNTDADAIAPAPLTPSPSVPHPFDDVYSDADSEGTIRIRSQRQFTATDKARSQMLHFDGPEQV